MSVIILAHIIGDFYLQTDKIAEKKKNSNMYLAIHCILYTIVVSIGLYILTGNRMEILKDAGLIFLSHGVADLLKQKLCKKINKYEFRIFLLDQSVHIGSLFLIFCLMKQTQYLFHDCIVKGVNINQFVAVATAILLCWKPAAIFISLVFKVIPKTCIYDKNGSEDISQNSENEVEKIGYWIGILEREIILLLGLMGQFGAIGFVLTAKSLARFKQLEDKSFAEKYLIGTLLSAFIAIICIVLYRMVYCK